MPHGNYVTVVQKNLVGGCTPAFGSQWILVILIVVQIVVHSPVVIQEHRTNTTAYVQIFCLIKFGIIEERTCTDLVWRVMVLVCFQCVNKQMKHCDKAFCKLLRTRGQITFGVRRINLGPTGILVVILPAEVELIQSIVGQIKIWHRHLF